MGGWKSKLRADPVDWLLEEDNPSVRYYALNALLDKPINDPDVKRAKREIMRVGAVPEILGKEKKGGYWEDPENFYVDKYRGTVWQLITLAELGADGGDERIKKASEFIVKNSQDRKSGGFSVSRAKGGGGSRDEVLPCLTGNMVWSLIRFGRLEDLRVQRGINWIVRYQRFDDMIKEALQGWPYDRQGHPHCWGYTQTKRVHTCHMGVVKALKAFTEIPANKRSKDVKAVIKKGVEYLLIHRIFKRSHDLDRIASSNWLKFGFPLMWNTDTLEVLGILTTLGCRDGRMKEAVDLVISKQDDTGRWRLESTFNGRFQVDIEKKSKPSKWVTLNALKVLKGYYG